MTHVYRLVLATVFLVLFQGCSETRLRSALPGDTAATPGGSRLLAVYEPWFGHPRHVNVGYSSQDPVVVRRQIEGAKNLGISGFVVDWYGEREPFLDKAYALVQKIAAEQNFSVAMMYDEVEDSSDQATDDALVAFRIFHDKYMKADAAGRQAYLTYEGRPVIFIFPKGRRTDWHRVREELNSWSPSPLLIYENAPKSDSTPFDGFYAWVNPGKGGWKPDGSNWGEDYLREFYRTMNKYPDKIAVGAAWAGFDDRHASWSQGRFMSQRCGKTFSDTMQLYREYAKDRALPFLLIATWNDYEEGTAIERGLAKCEATGSPAPAS